MSSVTLGPAPASASPLGSDSIGVNVYPFTNNGQLGPNDLADASAAGVGLARIEMIQGTNHDPVVALTAAAHMRVYPMLGLPQQLNPSAAATAMAQYVTAFAQLYGPKGTFWSQNPQLPYLPVQRFEIGNEPNMPLQWVADKTNLHWTDPAAYAQVYVAARAALHRVDPSGVAVVGGLADSGGGGVDVPSDERWLAALPAGGVDAVGFHMYTNPATLETDTVALRQWMDGAGFGGVPLDVNEMGACYVTAQTTMNPICAPIISSSDWGAYASQYAQWALCRSDLNVSNVQVFYWGAAPWTDRDSFLPLVSSEQALTPYGQDYLAMSRTLTTEGCPPENSSLPRISGATVFGQGLTGAPGTWSPLPTSVAYQWSRCDTSGQNCNGISGATSTTYQVQSQDVGHTLMLSVTAGNAAGTTTAYSLASGVVAAGGSSGSGNAGGTSTTASAPSTASQLPRKRHRHRTAARPNRAPFVVAGIASMRPRNHFRVQWIRRRGGRVMVAVRVRFPAPQLGVSARSSRRRVRLRVQRGSMAAAGQPTPNSKIVVFAAALRPARWVISVGCVSRCANQSPVPLRLTILISRLAIVW